MNIKYVQKIIKLRTDYLVGKLTTFGGTGFEVKLHDKTVVKFTSLNGNHSMTRFNENKTKLISDHTIEDGVPAIDVLVQFNLLTANLL